MKEETYQYLLGLAENHANSLTGTLLHLIQQREVPEQHRINPEYTDEVLDTEILMLNQSNKVAIESIQDLKLNYQTPKPNFHGKAHN